MTMTLQAVRNNILNDKGHPVTQTEFGELIGVSMPTVNKMEKDPDRVSIRLGKKISEVSGIPFEVIFLDRN